MQIIPLLNDSTAEGKITEFILEASDIYIVGCSKEYEDVKVFGSKSDKILKEYLAADNLLDVRWNKLKKEKDEFERAGDISKMNQHKE